jgi:hypothetical protein
MPDVMARMTVAQSLMINQPSSPADAIEQARQIANENRAKKGLPPVGTEVTP